MKTDIRKLFLLPALAVVSGGLVTAVSPAFALSWAQTSAPFTNWTAVASSADGTYLVATVDGGGIYTSTNSGTTWTQTSAPNERWLSITSSADGRKLLALASFGPVSLSTDSGMAWVASTASTAYGQCAASAADGSHFSVGNYDWVHNYGGLLASTDSGASWNSVNDLFAVSIACSADGIKLVEATCGNYFSAGLIATSTNAGASWNATGAPPNNWQAVACSADGSKVVAVTGFWHPDSFPGSGIGSGPVYISPDSGRTWTQSSAPSNNWSAVASSADGSHLVAMVSGGSIFVSSNSGVTWDQTAAPTNTWSAVASSADGSKLVAVVSGGGIYTSQSAPTPSLAITPSGTNAVIGWVIPSLSFTLQESPALTAINWADVTNASTVVNLTNLQNQVTVPVSPSGNRFYRLRH